jgi:hypothetical protein
MKGPGALPRVRIVSPALAAANNGNWHTAARWQRFLAPVARVDIVGVDADDAQDARTDLLIALHARRSAAPIARWRERSADAPLVLVLTGTDLYRDLDVDAGARHSLECASRIVVLQEAALARLDAPAAPRRSSSSSRRRRCASRAAGEPTWSPSATCARRRIPRRCIAPRACSPATRSCRRSSTSARALDAAPRRRSARDDGGVPVVSLARRALARGGAAHDRAGARARPLQPDGRRRQRRHRGGPLGRAGAGEPDRRQRRPARRRLRRLLPGRRRRALAALIRRFCADAAFAARCAPNAPRASRSFARPPSGAPCDRSSPACCRRERRR